MLKFKIIFSVLTIAALVIASLNLDNLRFTNLLQPKTLLSKASPVQSSPKSLFPMSNHSEANFPLTPIALSQNVAIPIPGTLLTATLKDYRYGRSRDADGREKVSAWASIDFTLPDGRQENMHWAFYETKEVFGYRLHLDGSRSEVLIYVLPLK